MPKPFPYKIGDKFGKLTVIEIEKCKDRKRLTCKCECGNIARRLHPHKVKSGHTSSCGCEAAIIGEVTHGLSRTREYQIWNSTKSRAKRCGIPFNIDVEDIVIPTHCPLLGIELNTEPDPSRRWTAPSIDRLIPTKGYVKGNVIIISMKANAIKSNATLDEIMLLADNLHNILVSTPA